MKKIDVLGKLFGSGARVKIIRLFLFNTDTPHETGDISKRTKVSEAIAKKEVSSFEKIGLVKKRSFFKSIEGSKKKKRVHGYVLNKDFYYLSALQNLLIKIPPFSSQDLERKFKSAGHLKLLIISGVFLQEWDSVVDLLIVGDRLNTPMVDRAVASLESEIGRELTYAVFETPEFEYRLNIHDKLIRDILDFSHDKVVNRLGL